MNTETNPAPRTPLNVGVHYRRSYARDESPGTLKNISLSGAFLAHRDDELKPGEKLNLNFAVAGRERQIQATVIWMHEEPMLPGRPYLLKIGAKTVTASIARVRRRRRPDSAVTRRPGTAHRGRSPRAPAR